MNKRLADHSLTDKTKLVREKEVTKSVRIEFQVGDQVWIGTGNDRAISFLSF